MAVDVTGFWRPRLQECPTSHYDSRAGKALPAIVVGIVARVGSVGEQRQGLVRADETDPSAEGHERVLVQRAVEAVKLGDVLVTDRGFGVRLLQEEGATDFVARVAKNFTARRAEAPTYKGRGRPSKRGQVVRPLARSYRGRELAAAGAELPRAGVSSHPAGPEPDLAGG